MWDALAPGPGMDPVTPALDVLTTGLPGKSQKKDFKEQSNFIHPGTKRKKNTKPNATRRKELTKIRAEVNEIQTREIKDQQRRELVF